MFSWLHEASPMKDEKDVKRVNPKALVPLRCGLTCHPKLDGKF
jgi:hypothetical protein